MHEAKRKEEPCRRKYELHLFDQYTACVWGRMSDSCVLKKGPDVDLVQLMWVSNPIFLQSFVDLKVVTIKLIEIPATA